MERIKELKSSAPGNNASEYSEEFFWDRYGTQTKWTDRLRLEKAIGEKRLNVDARPWKIYLEPTPRCNLQCCDWSENVERQKRPNLTTEHVETYLAELWSCLVQVNLYYWGEPFINVDLPDIISRIHDHHVGTCVQSNFQSMTKEQAEQTIRSGLDVLMVILDGATQRAYSATRKGGDLATAISNLGTFLKIRRRMQSETPRVIWRFTVYRHNEFEAQNAQRLAKKLGLDGFMLANTRENPVAWEPDLTVIPFDRATPETCHQIWSEPVILSDGRLMPSNNSTFGKFDIGNVKDGFHQAFNSEGFKQARQACTTVLLSRRPACSPAISRKS